MDNKNCHSRNIFILTIIISFLLIILGGCTGKEVFSSDDREPDRPSLIPHLGSIGDGVFFSEDNNGIDTVPDGNWLRIQWDRIDDPDLDYMKIYRFGEYSPVTLVDSLSRSRVQRNEYLDDSLHRFDPVGQKWSYFTELFITNGNYSVSDTVDYVLMEKPFLLAPDNYEQVEHNSLLFEWLPTDDTIHYRLLVLGPNREYIWHEDYYVIEDSDFTLDYAGPDLSEYVGETIIWRVDTYGDINNEIGIPISRAKSLERYVELR